MLGICPDSTMRRSIPFGPTVKKSVAAEQPVVTLRYSYFPASIMQSGSSVPKCPWRFARERTSSATSAIWRTSSAVSPVVTYDGEIVDPVGTEVLRGVKSGDPGGAAPTAGYMGYRILRRMYPKTKIVLVNFFGNSHGFKVCERHNTDWEQEEYRKDPLVESMTVDEPAKKQGKETK